MNIDLHTSVEELTTKRLGDLGEDATARYLLESGYRIVERNWRCRYGEIDIVAQTPDALVFVEVKTRRSLHAASPLEALTPVKLRRLRRLAGLWLAEHPNARGALRIDLAAIEAKGRTLSLTHLEAIG